MRSLTAARIILAFLVLVFSATSRQVVNAQVEENVNATVRVPICGDGTSENPEECDGSDLNNATCENMGYGPGTLSCDIACGIDYSLCATPTPTPVPSTTPTITPTPTAGTSSSTTPSNQTTTSSSPLPINLVETGVELIQETLCLPTEVLFFDPNQDCQLTLDELDQVVTGWIDEIKKRPISTRDCDINLDQSCNLVDFSVLMFYVK